MTYKNSNCRNNGRNIRFDENETMPYGNAVIRNRDSILQREKTNHSKTLSMVYSPLQAWDDIYDGEKALKRGTVFGELDMPFFGQKGCGCK